MTFSNDYDVFLEEVGVSKEDVDRAYAEAPLPLPKLESEHYEKRESVVHGEGIFSTTDFCSGDTIGVLRFADQWTEAGRYINHSVSPNTEVTMTHYGLVAKAITPITLGEEIVIDYRDMRQCVKLQELGAFVVDNFCEDHSVVASSAKAAGFSTWLPNKGEVGSSIYGGMGFWGQHAPMLRSLINATGSVLVPNSMFFRNTNVGMEKAYIHSDREAGAHTCVVYLSEHEEESGTAFFKHKPTGLLHMPSFQEMKDLGIAEQLKEDMVSRSEENWEQVAYVPGKLNRALIFDAPLFHSRFPLEGIGNDSDNGRLIWASHFYKLDGYGQLF